MKQTFQMITGSFLMLFTYLFGGMDTALITLLIAIGIDCISGIAKAYIKGTISSKAGVKGFIKKLCYLCLVAVAVIVDQICNSNGVIRTFMIYYFVINECISILENCAAMNLPIPKTVLNKLEQLKKEADEKV